VTVPKYSAGNGEREEKAAYSKMKFPSEQQMDINRKLDKIPFQFRQGIAKSLPYGMVSPRADSTNRKCMLVVLFPAVNILLRYFGATFHLARLSGIE
jgi:hypothetical protein